MDGPLNCYKTESFIKCAIIMDRPLNCYKTESFIKCVIIMDGPLNYYKTESFIKCDQRYTQSEIYQNKLYTHEYIQFTYYFISNILDV